MSGKRFVNVSIISDLMCPWCWVGLRHLQKASKETNIETRIKWYPFMLRPNIPSEGTPKGGSPASRVGDHLRQAGKAAGIDFTGLTDRTPNTALFHATIKYLQEELQMDSRIVTEFHEAVFEGYFTTGVYPDKNGILLGARKVQDQSVSSAIEQLYDSSSANKLSSLEEQVVREAMEVSRKGISGVPTFLFDGQTSFSGAQPVSVFVRSLEQHAKVES